MAKRQLPTISKGAKWLLIVSTALSVGFIVSGQEISTQLGHWLLATPHSIWQKAFVWQLMTSPLIEPEMIGLLFQGFMLWMFIPSLERWWGTKRFLSFCLYTSLAGVVVGTLVGLFTGQLNVPAAGLDPTIFASLIAFGILFSKQPVQFFGVVPMTGKQLAIGISAVALLLIFVGKQWVQGGANVGAMVMAILICKGKFTPRIWALKWKQRRLRKKIKIVKDDDVPPKKWMN